MKRSEEVRKKIGVAAMQCYARYGLEKTTLEDIASVVGLNKSSLYYYFKSKEDIFLTTGMEEGERYISLLQKETKAIKGIEKQVVYYMVTRFEYYKNIMATNGVSSGSLNKILPGFFDLYEAMRSREKLFLSDLLKESIGKKEIKKCNTVQIASLFINVSDALKHSTEQKAIILGEITVDYTQAIDDMKLMVHLIFKALK